MTIVKLKPGFIQVCVWPGCIVGAEEAKLFEEDMALVFDGVRVQYLEEIETLPGQGGPGGRNDLLFAVHTNDVTKFAVPRLGYGISWIEDAWANWGYEIYPERVVFYSSWDARH